jgi:hypothetical protein
MLLQFGCGCGDLTGDEAIENPLMALDADEGL